LFRSLFNDAFPPHTPTVSDILSLIG